MPRFFALFGMSIVIIFFLASCTTVLPKKTYSYIPPKSAADVQCMNKCYYARKNCLKICALKNKRYCDCVTSFNTCYAACGGQVVSRGMTLSALW